MQNKKLNKYIILIIIIITQCLHNHHHYYHYTTSTNIRASSQGFHVGLQAVDLLADSTHVPLYTHTQKYLNTFSVHGLAAHYVPRL